MEKLEGESQRLEAVTTRSKGIIVIIFQAALESGAMEIPIVNELHLSFDIEI